MAAHLRNQVRGADQPGKQNGTEDANSERAGPDEQPNQWPQSRIAQNAEKIWNRLANPNRPRPAKLMLPHLPPIHGARPAFDDDRAKLERIALLCNAIAQLIIIGQAIDQ